MITRFEINNKYDVKNNLGQMVYFVTEDTDDFTRNAYRTLRPFVLRVTDSMGREIMTMQRPFRCTCCCFCCPSTRQEVKEWKSNPLFLSDPPIHTRLCSFQNCKGVRGRAFHGPCEKRENQIVSPQTNNKGLFLSVYAL